jgi:CRISPR type III-B/RAMP module RAMP protein Cmr1
MNLTIPVTFITPCFCRGADCSEHGAPEIRPPSIRGQLHWWFRALGGAPADENAIFGNVHGGEKASKIVIRVKYGAPVAQLNATARQFATLPHKNGGMAALKNALPAGTTFTLLVSTRLGGLSPALEAAFKRALDAWLLLGSLGLRATRGGGNFTWAEQPAMPADYVAAVEKLLNGTHLQTALLGKTYTTAEAARCDITDTLAHGAFAREHFPLGAVKQGRNDTSGAPSRKTSPLRFRVIKFAASDFRIAAIWDGRQAVTGNTDADLKSAIRQLAAAGKSIGTELANSPLAC